jgi:hypothetical protein
VLKPCLWTAPRPFSSWHSDFFTGAGEFTGRDAPLVVAWRALVLAIGVCYYLRLDSQYVRADGSLVDLRSEFRVKFGREVDRAPAALRSHLVRHRCEGLNRRSPSSFACVGSPPHFTAFVASSSFSDILSGACISFFEKCKIPRGIARTNGLMENMVSRRVWGVAFPLRN